VGIESGQRFLGATRVTIVPRQLNTAAIMLAQNTPDRDGDGVPDAIDDCPAQPDPHQYDSTGMPPGDACRTVVAMPMPDLAVPDLAGTPPPPPDMTAPRDLTGTRPPDMEKPISTCASLSVPLCDGFEGKTLASWWTTVIQSGGTATIDTTRAYRGSSSLHLHNNALTNVGSDVELDESQAFFNHFYVRAFVYVPAHFDPSEADIIFAEQNAAPYEGIALEFLNGSLGTSDTLNNGVVKTTTTAVATDQWVCLEWEVTLGTASNHNGSTALSVDGTGVSGLGGNQPLYATPAINQIDIGLIGYNNTPARDFWLDELIIDVNPIGCTK
jgi:hypothetical protein